MSKGTSALKDFDSTGPILGLPLNPLALQPLSLLNPPRLQPLGQVRVLERQVLHGEAAQVHLEPVPAGPATETAEADGVPEGRSGQKLAPAVVGDGQVINGLDVGGPAHVLDGGDEALCARVEQVTGLWTVVGHTPLLHFVLLLRREARGLAEGDEPGWEPVLGDT